MNDAQIAARKRLEARGQMNPTTSQINAEVISPAATVPLRSTVALKDVAVNEPNGVKIDRMGNEIFQNAEGENIDFHNELIGHVNKKVESLINQLGEGKEILLVDLYQLQRIVNNFKSLKPVR